MACFATKGGTAATCAECGNATNKMHGPGAANRNTWNSNSWPYETSRVLRGLANVLHNFDIMSESVNPERYHSADKYETSAFRLLTSGFRYGRVVPSYE